MSSFGQGGEFSVTIKGKYCMTSDTLHMGMLLQVLKVKEDPQTGHYLKPQNLWMHMLSMLG